MFILTLRDNEKHFYIVLHGLLRRVFCSPRRVLVGRSGRARGVYQWRKEGKADGGTEARRLPWGECSRGHRMMKSSMMRMNVSLVSTVKSSAKSALHTHVLSSGELGVRPQGHRTNAEHAVKTGHFLCARGKPTPAVTQLEGAH